MRNLCYCRKTLAGTLTIDLQIRQDAESTKSKRNDLIDDIEY